MTEQEVEKSLQDIATAIIWIAQSTTHMVGAGFVNDIAKKLDPIFERCNLEDDLGNS